MINKIAVCILAHKNFTQLKRLVERISHPYIDIYIHLDKKFIISKNQIAELKLLNDGRINICSKRYNVFLFSYTMVNAEIELIKCAKKNYSYLYYMLISAQDYPIKNINYIYDYIINLYPKQFLDVTMWHEGNWVYSSFNTTRVLKALRGKIRYFINKHIKIRFLNAFSRGINFIFFSFLSMCKQLICGSPFSNMKKKELEISGGSQWWILTDNMIDECLYRYNDKKFNKIFKNVGSSDETYFQAIAVNSPYKSQLTINEWNEVKQKTFTYTDFFGENEVSNGHPIILKMKNYNDFKNTNFLFARKFDINIDEEILNIIDKELLGWEEKF